MRVRISYGVEIEEVPDHASSLGHDALMELKNCVRSLERNLEHIDEIENDYSVVILGIEKIRKILVKADAILVDTGTILEGLQNYHHGGKDVSEGRSTMDTSGNTTDET